MKILVINGPNLNMLGIREPDIYGRKTYADLLDFCRERAAKNGDETEFYQSNHEGDLVDRIQQALGAADAILINPGAYTHTSVAILDAVKAVSLPTVEVHLSDPDSREEFRHVSFIRLACAATFSGKGFESYGEALDFLSALNKNEGKR